MSDTVDNFQITCQFCNLYRDTLLQICIHKAKIAIITFYKNIACFPPEYFTESFSTCTDWCLFDPDYTK